MAKALFGKQLFQGVDVMDVGAAVAGLAASTMIPGLIVKDTTTSSQKLGKLAASLVTTMAAGYVLKGIGPNAGKMAVLGGLAGTVTQALSMFTPIKIGQQQNQVRYLGQPNTINRPRLAESRVEVPGESSAVQVSVT